MARTIVDEGLKTWEAFASTGQFGYSSGSRLIFTCVTDPGERPRGWTLAGDKSDAETVVAEAPAQELLALLGKAAPLR